MIVDQTHRVPATLFRTLTLSLMKNKDMLQFLWAIHEMA